MSTASTFPTVSKGSVDEIIAMVGSAIVDARGATIFGLNAEVCNQAFRDPDFASVLERADVLLPDGISVVVASRILGRSVKERVPTPSLVDRLVVERTGIRTFLLGSSPKTNEAAGIALVKMGADVVGRSDGYFPRANDPVLLGEIARLKPSLVLIAMPSPTKERLALRVREASPTSVVIGVGGYFEILAGVVHRAPDILGRLGLEWAFRLVQEPRRLGRRYVVGNLLFVWRVLCLWRGRAMSTSAR